ncbi:hypothetical protein JW916_14850 [Candidatus Sumerlaeota bacterium]|nr:hypothetical protein [Candidatus Sumerlaeota bacterium]
MCTCTHPDKTHYLTKDSCPLYRMDWTRATERVAFLRRQFRVKSRAEMSAGGQMPAAPQGGISFAAAEGMSLSEKMITPFPAES